MELHQSLWLFQCVCLFFVICQCYTSLGCINDERMALLEIKVASSQFDDRLSTNWVEDKTSDHCAWKFVKCSDKTGCVSQLLLSGMFFNYNGGYHPLNISLFLPFKNLQHLDISSNFFNGWGNQHGIERLSKLKKLEVLNLHGNDFNSSVLEPLSELTSLKTLNLAFNNYISEGPSSVVSQEIERLSKLKKLEVLNLDSTHFNHSVLKPLRELTSLKTLYLRGNNIGEGPSSVVSQGGNHLEGDAFTSLSEIVSLQTLYLDLNYLRISLEHSKGFCEMKKLRELGLSYNNLTGNIPQCLKDFTSLRMLDLNYNLLSGNIPPSLTSNMTSLRWLDLSDNQLTGSISPPLVSNSTSLALLDLSHNQLSGNSLQDLTSNITSQIVFLGLANCNLNISTPILTKFLQLHHDLRFLDLSHNNIHGKFPASLFEDHRELKVLHLQNNSISGPIQFPVHTLNLAWIDISDNPIEGRLQKNIGDILHGVEHLNFSNNGLEGKIPNSLGNISNLITLDLSKNNFTGEIPESLGVSNRLFELTLSYNRLYGQISPTLLSHMSTLRLNNNHFTGFVQIPNNNSVSIYNNFFTLDVSQNNIKGRIPTWIANITWLRSLILGDNSFEGPIPMELCNLGSLEFLDLSENEFSGSIPSFLNLTSLTYMHLHGNLLSGPIPNALLRSPQLATLDLNNNNFSGGIPVWLGSLQNLVILLLKGNRLCGFVPSNFCKLKEIQVLDLSHNGFSGSIPPCFSKMAFGKTRSIELRFEGPELDTSMSMNLDEYTSYDEPSLYEVPFSYSFGSSASQEEVEFMTKGLSNKYKGNILNYISGMDLSCNNFTGQIPHEFGILTEIYALNLSHNQFTGSIPKSFLKLKKLESMDLSYNNLSGGIPSELTQLTFLSTFLVAYNNLSGRVPDTNQFGTFGEINYQGNLYLCGEQLINQCNRTSTTGLVTGTNAALSDIFGVDPISFLASCVVAYIMSLVVPVIVLYVNPYWRRLWFDFIDTCLSFVFPFWSEAIYRVSNP